MPNLLTIKLFVILFYEWNKLFLAVKQVVLALKQLVSDCT